MITADDISRHWNLGQIHAMVELSRAGRRSVWRIQAENCACTLKSASDWESDAELATQLHLLAHLAGKNLSLAPGLIPTRDGLHFARIGEDRWFAMQFVAGASPEPSADNYRKLGRVLACLHGITDFPIETEYTIANLLSREIPQIAAGLPFQSEYLALAGSLRLDDGLPHSVIHTDPSLQNAVLRPDGSLILIDWECSGMGATIIDIGHQLVVRFLNGKGELVVPEARAFYTSYFAARPMLGYDAMAIFDTGVLIALFFIVYGDMAANWQRITRAVKNRTAILEHLVEWANPAP